MGVFLKKGIKSEVIDISLAKPPAKQGSHGEVVSAH